MPSAGVLWYERKRKEIAPTVLVRSEDSHQHGNMTQCDGSIMSLSLDFESMGVYVKSGRKLSGIPALDKMNRVEIGKIRKDKYK
jgi:hypothetical protein